MQFILTKIDKRTIGVPSKSKWSYVTMSYDGSSATDAFSLSYWINYQPGVLTRIEER